MSREVESIEEQAGDEYPPLKVEELLGRAESCALTADARAGDYQANPVISLSNEVAHLAALSQAYTALAVARMRVAAETATEDDDEDPRTALMRRAGRAA